MRLGNKIFIALLVLWAWGAWGDLGHLFAERWTSDAKDMATAGQWGDSYGAFNALVSAGGFAVLLVTLDLQRRAIREQASDLHRQRFESSFFELLRLMRDFRREINFRHSDDYARSKVTGSSTLKPIIRTTLTSNKHDIDAIRSANVEIVFWLLQQKIAKLPTKEALVSIYMKRIHSKSEASFGPYFRTVYTMLDRIRSDKILSDDEKIRFANLLRGQLTSPETTLLAINALAPVANDLMKLITDYRMLKYLPENAMRRRLENLYLPTAFEPRGDI